MTKDETPWLKLYQDRLDGLKKVYLSKESPLVRARILSLLEQIALESENFSEEVELQRILNESRKNTIGNLPRKSYRTRKDFHKILKTLRKERGISQENLADAVNVHSRSIARYESGNCKPRYIILRQIAAYFDMPINFFYEEYDQT